MLLIRFFHYFAWLFDYKNDIISARHNHPNSITSKISKAENDAWSQHDRLSIEDPFETWYDVAHVIKPIQMKYLRNEFLVS